MENDKIIKDLLNKATKEEKEFLLMIFESPSFSKYVASKTQTNFWDNELTQSPSSLRVGGESEQQEDESEDDEKPIRKQQKEANNNKEFEYSHKYLLTMGQIKDVQKSLYADLTKEEKELADEKTKKKILKSGNQVAIKRS